MRHRLVAALSSLLLMLAVLGVVSAPAASAATRIIPVPTSAAGLGRIVASPDGNVWFVERDANKVGRVSPDGTVAEFAFPAEFPGTTQLKDLDVAPDGTVWVVYESGERVRHITAAGATISDGAIGEYPYGEQVRVAPDGTAWITMSYDEDYVIRISGSTIYDDPNAPPCQDALGEAADGSMWCRTASGLTHLNATASGGVTYPVNNYAAYPYAIAAGPVGSIWFGRYVSGTFVSSPDDGEVGFLDAASGQVTAYDTGSRTAPNDLVRGPDGTMWFTSIGAAKGIGHISPNGSSGALTAIGNYAPSSLTFGTDGALYAADSTNNVIIKAAIGDLQVTNVDPGEGSVLYGPQAGAVKTAKKPVVLRGKKLGLKLTCPADAAKGCAGTARLFAKSGKPVSGARTYAVKAGQKGKLRLELTKKGLKSVKRGKVTKLRLALSLPGGPEPVAVQVVKVRR